MAYSRYIVITALLLWSSAELQHKHIIFHAQLDGELHAAYTQLMNCTYFRNTYKRIWRRWSYKKSLPTTFGSERGDGTYLAYVTVDRKTIVVADVYFDQTEKERISTMGHELMHVMGLPDHDEDRWDELSDPVYLAERICYGYRDELPWQQRMSAIVERYWNKQ